MEKIFGKLFGKWLPRFEQKAVLNTPCRKTRQSKEICKTIYEHKNLLPAYLTNSKNQNTFRQKNRNTVFNRSVETMQPLSK
jgi:hypothetical protein